MKHIKTIFTLLVFAVSSTCHQSAGAQEGQFEIPKSVLGSGGEAVSNSSFRIVGTVGQPVIGVASSSSNINEVGFWYQAADLITSVEQIPSETVPKEFRLDQNYPNPFNPTTTIQFALPKRSAVTLKLFDILGREVATLVEEELQPGEYKILFEAEGLPSGVYFYRIQAEGFVKTKKLMLLR